MVLQSMHTLPHIIQYDLNQFLLQEESKAPELKEFTVLLLALRQHQVPESTRSKLLPLRL